MARQSRGRLRLGRIFSPKCRSAAAVASAEAQEKRRKKRVQKWRDRFKRLSLSVWHQNAIVATVCNLFKSSADAARVVREATTSQVVGAGWGRQLRVEGLEQRQMLNATYHNLTSSNFSQDWSNTSLITTDNDWSTVPSIIGYSSNDFSAGTGIDPQTVVTPTGFTPIVTANQNNPSTNSSANVAEFQPVFVDNFEYANQAAFDAVWTVPGTAAATLTTEQAVSGTKSVKAGTAAMRSGHNIGFELPTPSATNVIVYSFDFYDANASNFPIRQYGEIVDGAGTSSGQLVAMGMNNTLSNVQDGGNYYFARIVGFTPTYLPSTDASATPATSSGASFKLNGPGAPLRSTGWHNLRVEISSTTFNFFVDGILSKSIANAFTLRQYDQVRLGSNLSSSSAGYFDNVLVGTQPAVTLNPVVGLQPTNAVDAASLNVFVNSAGRDNVTISYKLRDIDGAADDAVQPVALQYRTGGVGDFINVPAAFISDATTGPSLTTSITTVTATLPAWSNVADIEFRIITANAGGNDEWVGVDDISVTSTAIIPPVFTSTATASVAENTTLAKTLTATDASTPAQTVTFSITDGADGTLFTITGGNQLHFITAPDFENPTDADLDNVYAVQVTANDDNGGTTVQNLTITVTAANDNSPIFTSGAALSVNENTTPVVTLATTDADLPSQAVTFSKTGGADSALFTLVGNQLSFASGRNFENKTDADNDGVYEVQITANDGAGGITVQNISVTVLDVNENPIMLPQIFSVAENAPNGTVIGQILATDGDAGTQSLQFDLQGTTGPVGAIAVSSTGLITVANSSLLDREALASFALSIDVTDDGSPANGAGAIMTINVSDVDEFPVIAGADEDAATNAVNENAPINTPVGIDASATDGDADAVIVYSLIDDFGGRFAIDSATGVVKAGGTAIDRETDASFSLVVRATSGLSFVDMPYTVAVNDVDEFNVGAISDIDAATDEISESASVNALVPILAQAAPDLDATTNAITYSLDDSAGGRFSIDPSTGRVKVALPLDRETDGASLGIIVRATSADTSFTTASYTIALLAENEFTPVIGGNVGDNVTEDTDLTATGNVLTGNVSDSDLPGDSLSIVPLFVGTNIPGSYGTLDLAANGAYTYSLTNAAVQSLGAGGTLFESFLFQVTDGVHNSLDAFLNITINGTNDAPLIIGTTSGVVDEDGTLIASGGLSISDVDTGEAAFVPAATSTTYGNYTLDSAGNWVYTLNNANVFVQGLNTGQTLNDSFNAVSIDGTIQTINILINGLDEPPGVIILNGDGNSNSLVIDLDAMTYSLDGGAPVSLVGIGDFTFNAGGGSDSITITGGTFGTVTYDYTNANDGNVDLSDYGLMLHYTGLDPLSNDGSVANAIFNLPSSSDSASLLISSPGNLTLSSSPITFESTTFSMPSTSITVNANDGDDTITVQPSNGYAVTVTGGNQTIADQLNVNAGGAYAINTGTEIRVQGKANIGYSGFEAVNLTGALATPTTLYVDATWAGTTAGDDPDGLGAAINFGVDSFATLADALAAANDNYTIIVHAGTYTGSYVIDDKVTIIGAGDGVVTLNANGDFTGIEIQDVVSISGVSLTNYFSTGILVSTGGNLTLSSSTVTGGLTGISVVTGTLDMDHTIISGVGVVGVQVGSGGFADIETSEITGTATTAAGVAVSSGNALIDNTIITGSNRGVLVSSTGTATVHGSKVTGNTIGNIVNGTVNTINASGNFWGTNTDAAIAATLVGPVDFTPFIDATTSDLDGGARGFSGDFSHLHVTTAGGQTGGAGRVQEGVNEVAINGTVDVHVGTYIEDVNVNKAAHLIGANHNTTTISGAIGGSGATVQVTASNVEIANFTITREGNTVAQWNNAGLNSAGVAVQGLVVTGMLLRDNIITGNRTGVDINQSGGHTIRNNQITNNRTGMILRNETDGLTVTENEVTNNWTVGILFLDGNNGASGPPAQHAFNSHFNNNNISGNWYGQIVDRQTSAFIPTPGTTNLKDFSSNWFGTNAPVISAANSTEPGYAAQVPVIFGGSAVAPGGQPDILGPASANFDITPYLDLGTDTNVETVPLRGTFGFQGNFNTLHVTDALAQTGASGRIQEGIDTVAGGGTLLVHPGSYAGGADATAKAVTIAPGTTAVGVSTGQVVLDGNLSLNSDDTLQIQLNGTTTLLYDNIVVTGTVSLGNATLAASRSFGPFPGQEFILIDNDSTDPVTGTFNGLPDGSIITLGGIPFTLNYDGGVDSNDVTLTVAAPGLVYANDTWIEQADTSGGGAGIQVGDTVQSNTGAGDANVTGLIFGYNAFNTIQGAINAVSIGGTVNVLAGSYIENVVVNKSVEIAGAGEASTTVLPSFVGANTGGGSLAPGSSNVFLVQANSVTIHDLTVDGNNTSLTSGALSNGVDVDARNGIITDHLSGVYNALNVHDVTVKNIYLRGMYASSGGTFSFVDNTVDNVAGDAASIGILNFGGSGLIQGNTVSNANDAIASNWSTGTQFLNNIVTNSGSGIHTDNSGGPDVIQGNQVSNGSILGGSYGIFVFVPYSNIVVSGNTVTNVDVGLGAFGGMGGSTTFTGNTVDTSNRAGSLGAWVSTDTFGYGQMNVSATFNGNNDITNADTGIYVQQLSGATATVDIDGNSASIHGNAIGIDVDGGSATITGNHIYDNTTGIRFVNGGTGTIGGALLADGNNFNDAIDNATDILVTASAGTVTIGANNQFAADTFFVDNQDTQNILATGNTFDVANNFRVEDKMSHEVDNLALGLVTWVANNVYVTTPSLGSTDSSVQQGVDAADNGYTVNVEDGIYVEQVGIAKNISLVGSSISGTMVRAPGTLGLGNSFSYGGRTRQSVIAVTGGSVTIDSLTVDGNGAGATVVGGNDFHGIGVHNADAIIQNVKVTGVRDATLSGAQRGRAIFAGNDSGSHLLTVTGSTVEDYQKNGIDLRGLGQSGLLTNNTITGAGPTAAIAQNGVVVLGGATSSISGNTITDHEYTGGGDYATGILLYGAGAGTSVTSNLNLDDNQVGVYLANGSSGITITGNTITGSSQTGIAVSGGSAKIQGNTILGSAGNQVGIQVSDDATVDAGGGGLGSTGGNILTGYTGVGGSYAIENLNLDVPNNVDVYAQNNSFGSAVPSAIEQVVFHTVDDSQYTLVLFTPAVGPVVPAAVYVNDDWFGTGLGMDPNAGYANGNLFGTDAFASIQDAINAVGTNATIYVLNGTYNEAVVINKAGTTLQHLDTLAEPVDPNLATEAYVTRTFGSNSAVIQVTADGVTIDDFHIIINRPNSTVGIGASNTASSTFLGGSFDDLTISNNVITSVGTGGLVDSFLNTLSSGIALVGNGTPFEKVAIQGNTVDITGGAPAGFQHRAVWLREIEASVTGNDLKGKANDLIVQFAASATSTATTISGNTFRSGGVDLTENAASGAINLTNNQFLIASPTSSQSLVIKHDVAAPILVQGNTFTGHAIGISMGNSAGVTIDNNDFTPGAFANTADIVLDTANFTGGSPAAPFLPLTATITKNEFFGAADVNNHVALALYNRNPGAAAPDYGTVTIGGSGAENTFHKDLDTFIYLDPATLGGVPVAFDFDASQNKFEVTGSPVAGVLPTGMTLGQLFEVEDKIVHAVDVASLGFVTILPGNVYVTTNSYFAPVTTTPSIQRGIDAATAGDTVNVAVGTYTEQVNIAKNLTLLGESQAGTVIQAPAALGLGNSFVYGGLTRQSVVAVTAGNVTIDSLTVDGNGRGATVVPGNDFHGIGIHNADATVQNVTVKGVRDAVLGGAQRGRAIFAGNDLGTHTVNVTGSTVNDYQKNGIDMRGAGLTANVTGNTITGAGPIAAIAQNGIAFVLGATGTISGNSVSGHAYTGVGASSAGILLFSPGAGAIVSNNLSINNNQLGIATDASATILGNTITGSTLAGISVAGGSVAVTNNSVTLSGAGLSVDGGTVKAQGNILNGNTIGALIQNGGIADLGQAGKTGPSNFTGLGISSGNNDFSGYTTTATTTAGAIVDLNTNGANANAGRQGAPFDVTAFGNTWAVPTANGIENVVYHDSDAPGVGFVDFANFGSLSVTADSATTINEGGSVSISGSFANVPQAHTITILWGDGSNTVINNLSGDFDFSSSHVYADNTDGTPFSLHNITVTVSDASAAVIGPSAAIVVHVDNTNPTIPSYIGPNTAGTGQTKHYTFTAADLGDVPAERFASVLLIPSGGASASLVGPVVFDGTNGSFDVLFTALPGGGSVDVQLTVTDDDGGSDVETITVGVGNTLQVTNFVTNPSGFDVTFNRPLNLNDLNLYDGRKASEVTVVIDPADIIVTRQVGLGPATVVNGSMVWDTLTNTLSWIKSGSILADDVLNYTYNVTLKSGATAFHDAFGNLDGNGDFDDTPGEDYTNSFGVAATTARVVSIHDFARGPGQNVDDNPGTSNRLAVSIDDATNVRSLNFHFHYDTNYMVINGASLAPGLAGMGWTITVNNLTPGDLIVSASSPANELSGTDVNVIIIDATIKTTAAYGGSEILRFDTVNMGVESGMSVVPVAHVEDRAIHKNVYLGDTSGDHLYDGFDVTLASRVAVGFDTGFAHSDWTDPLVIGDINRDGVIDSIDTAIIGQKAVFPATTPQIPNIVVLSPVVLGTGADPTLSIGDAIPAGIGGPVVIPVQIAVDPNVTLSSATYTVQYNPTKLSFVGVTGASVFSGWGITAGADSGTITILMSDAVGHTTGGSVENLQLANITFNVLETFIGGVSNLNIAPVNPNEGGLVWSNNNVDDGSVQFALLGDYNQNGVVDTADRTVWRNTFGQSVTPYSGADGNGNGVIDNDDFNVWRSHFGISAVPGPGAGAGAGDELAAAFSMSLSSPSEFVGSVGSGTELVETNEPVSVAITQAPSPRVERQAARDEAFIGLVDSFAATRSIARPAGKVGAKLTATVADAVNDLLAGLSTANHRSSSHDDGCLSHDDHDVDAVDELFASIDDESLKAAISL